MVSDNIYQLIISLFVLFSPYFVCLLYYFFGICFRADFSLTDDDSQLDKLKRALAEFEKEYRKSLMEEKKPDSNNNSSSDNEKRKANGGAGKDGSDKDSSDGPPKLSWRTIALVTGIFLRLFIIFEKPLQQPTTDIDMF